MMFKEYKPLKNYKKENQTKGSLAFPPYFLFNWKSY